MNKIKLRKTKKYLSENKMRIVLIFTLLFSFFLVTGYSIYSALFAIEGVTNIEFSQDDPNCKSNVSGFLQLNSKNPNNENGKTVYNYSLKVENTGTSTIEGWTLLLKGPSDLSVNWANANVEIRSDNALVLTPYNWNSTINAGSNFDFTFAIETVETNLQLTSVLFEGCSIRQTTKEEEENPYLTLTEIVLTPIQETLEVGQTLTMRAVKNPLGAPGTLTWTSSNPSVATVNSSGKVTAVSEGTTYITVASGNISTRSTIHVTASQVEDPNTDDIISIAFSSPYYYEAGREMQFRFVITNHTNQAYKKFSFKVSFPANCTYQLWQNPGCTISGNTFTFDMLYNQTLPANGTTELTGNITFPEGYSVTDYLNPTFSNIRVIE